MRAHTGVRFAIALGILLGVLLTGCDRSIQPTPSQSAAMPLLTGTSRYSLTHDGRDRSYIVHVPHQAVEGRPLPMVLNYHGGGGNAQGQADYSRMDTLADEMGFIAVYPNGTGRLADRLLTWNAGTCCGYARDHEVDDVGFTRALITDLAARTSIDRSRVYATGLSNGAMMAFRLAAEAPDLVAAIAPVAGAMVVNPLEAAAPVPILHIHSVDDLRALYYGGLGPPFPFTNQRVDHNPVEEVLTFWAENNGCSPSPTETALRLSRPDPNGAEHTATRLDYGPCSSGADVVLWKLTGAGHVWPGAERDYLKRLLGPGTDVIDANREMWHFFEQFELRLQTGGLPGEP